MHALIFCCAQEVKEKFKECSGSDRESSSEVSSSTASSLPQNVLDLIAAVKAKREQSPEIDQKKGFNASPNDMEGERQSTQPKKKDPKPVLPKEVRG